MNTQNNIIVIFKLLKKSNPNKIFNKNTKNIKNSNPYLVKMLKDNKTYQPRITMY